MKNENSYDGFLDLDIKDDGTYIIVYAPNEGGKKVEFDDAVKFLKLKDIRDYDVDALKEALNSQKDREIKKISKNSAPPTKDEQMIVEISKNKMFSVIHFKEPQSDGRLLTKDEILDILKQKGILYGIDINGIDEILANKQYNFKYLIARGKEARNGQNGKLSFNFDIEKKTIQPKIEDDGTVNFKNLDLIEMVKKGQILVTATPPTQGIDGIDIFGVEKKAIDGKNATLPKGKNVKISANGMDLESEIDGQITYADGKVSVYSSYEVPANVDNSTGNIDFVGNVIVKGNILTGFSVKAGGSIEVYGAVEGAELEADGDIILYRGMQGVNRGKLKSGGNITAKYIENSTIEARGSVRANAIMHSEVKCGTFISLEGKKGLLVGGKARAGEQIEAKTIGSPMATTTELEVGIDPEILETYRNLKTESESVKAECIKMNQLIDPLTQLKKNGKIPPDKEERLEKAVKAKEFLQSKLQSIQDEIEYLEPKVHDRMSGRIKAYNVIYPGVKVQIGSVFTYIREEHKFCTVIAEHAEIKYYSYS